MSVAGRLFFARPRRFGAGLKMCGECLNMERDFDFVEFVRELVAFESVSADSSRNARTRACAEFLRRSFEQWGFESKLYETKLHPILFAKRDCPSGKPKARILFYGHYDVQPEDPLDKWDWPPFEASVAGGRIRGRGTADNKGPFSCVIWGMLNFLSKHADAPVEIAFMLEGEEEIGSPSMDDFITQHKELISGYDFIALSDTSSVSETCVVTTVGLRGTGSLELKFKGANTDLHSGMYGGAVYNPLQAMFEVCGSLHGPDGFVNIEHFYDDIEPLSDWEREEIKKNESAGKATLERLGLSEFYKQGNFTPDEALRALPTLEFTGVGGGYQGEGSKSVIASECFCKISCRAAAGQSIKKLLELVKKAVLERAPKAVKVEFLESDSTGDPYFVNPKNPPSQKLKSAFEKMEACALEVFGAKPLFLREGASIPLISSIKQKTGLDCLMLGLFQPQDNLHAPNESFSLSMARKGASYYEKFLEALSC